MFDGFSGKGKPYYHDFNDSLKMLLNFHRKNSRAMLRNLTEAILPQNDHFHARVEEEILPGIEKTIPGLPLPLRFGFAVGLYLIEWGPLFFMGKPRRFSRRVTGTIRRLYRDGGISVIYGKPSIVFQEGRCVGGSTVMNGGMSWHTPESVMDAWKTNHPKSEWDNNTR